MHVSISGKLDKSIDRAIEAGCVGTFQVFTCSPRKWDASELKGDEVESFRAKVEQSDFDVFAHMPYLPNLASPDQKIHSRSVDVLIREITRCHRLGINDLVLHFGSHMGTSIELGQARVITACEKALERTRDQPVRLLLENSAGVRNSVGSEFSFMRKIIAEIDNHNRIGVCFDTCHAFASGYDLRNPKEVATTIDEFDSIVGLQNLRLIHLNDSKGKLGDGKDRHENIGEGEIGKGGMKAILNSEKIKYVPIILETPFEKDGDDRRNIETAKGLIRQTK